MAKFINVEFRDDIDLSRGINRDNAREADLCVTFSIGVEHYELDLSIYTYEELRENFAPWIAAARKADAPHVNLPAVPEDPAAKTAKEAAARKRRDDIRAWAARHPEWKSKFNGKGRIPADLARDYDNEHSPV
jgi:hypothetical protein